LARPSVQSDDASVLFNSASFIFGFFPLVLLGFFLLGHFGLRTLAVAWTLIASLVFYGWFDPRRLLPIIAPANNLRAIARKIWVFSDYFEKKLLSGVRWKICNLMAFLCETRSISIYRDVHNGFWIWRGVYTYEEYGHLPIDPSRRVVAKLPDVAEVEKANRLINSTHIRRDCVVLTVTPNSELDADAYSTKMAAALGARVDLPEVDGLFTSDHSHLTWSSAQRWSAKFLEEIDPIIQSCVTSHQNPR